MKRKFPKLNEKFITSINVLFIVVKTKHVKLYYNKNKKVVNTERQIEHNLK